MTLALLRAFKNAGLSVVSAKSGPDYIDPKFHEAASGAPCINLDAWAMDGGTIGTLAGSHSAGHDLLIAEGAMGLFDGAANGKGSAADLASLLQLPVVLVVDCAKQAQSVAALVSGFKHFRSDVRLTGVILNRVGSARHEQMLRAALSGLDLAVLGAIPRSSDLLLPERHLGLVQAQEHVELEAFLDEAASICEDHLDLNGIRTLAQNIATPDDEVRRLPSPLGQRISVARDIALAFSYVHLLDHWRRMGAEISFFSPLANEAPRSDADAIYLPGGYPELHAGKITEAQTFLSGVKTAAESGALIYGECGGYMILGDGLVDADGCRHKMLGLLPLETSFQTRKRHLGYRKITPKYGVPWSGSLAAHEFHYASVVNEGTVDRLFSASDASGNSLPDMGLRVNNVMGSFAHVISRHQTTSSTQS